MNTSVSALWDEQTHRVLQAACAAPSLHNSQPWLFRLGPDFVELHLDRSRVLPVSDPDGREARLACGAALFNLRLALGRQGRSATVTLYPDGPQGAIARVDCSGEGRLSPELAELEAAIPHRRTNRRPYFDTEVPPMMRRQLVRAAETEAAAMIIISNPAEFDQLRRLITHAQRIQHADPQWLQEFEQWTRREGTPDGVPLAAAGPPPAPHDTVLVRDFGHPNRPERLPGKDFEREPLFALVSSFSDSPHDQVKSGQAMQRVLLTATSLGLTASFLSQVIEVPKIRQQVRELTGGRRYPQMLLRIGFGGPTPPTPRRMVEDCLLPSPTATCGAAQTL